MKDAINNPTDHAIRGHEYHTPASDSRSLLKPCIKSPTLPGMANFAVYPRLLAPMMIGGICLLGSGCDTEQRISRLEKQVQELQTEAKKDRTVADYDLQAKCSKDAKAWFRENWQADKDTELLDYHNHYNKSLNKCFVLVEQHSALGAAGSWTTNMTL